MRKLYDRYQTALEGTALPCAAVDLDAVSQNVATLLAPVRATKKTLRVATKSIRCLAVLRHILELGGSTCRGLMAFDAREALFLVGQGFRDVLLAYPTLAAADLGAIARANREDAVVSVVVDDDAHVDAIADAARAHDAIVPVVIEVDMSLRLLRGRLHLGVRRSPIRTADQAIALAERIAKTPHVSLHGVMAYEAQIAGLADEDRFAPSRSLPRRLIRHASRSRVQELRAEIAERFRQRGIRVEVFNGGGTGSVSWSSEEDALTEVTAGSGFLASHLFDGYRGLSLHPALFFALAVVRRPDAGVVTCSGGGYVASGAAGKDRLPIPWLPPGLDLFDLEGAGEVQTPLRVGVAQRARIALGDPVFFRPAKAGELAERFNDYALIQGDAVVARAPTYRGMGQAFL